MQINKHYLSTQLLKSVSRSFYLSLRFLPKAIREPLSLGYLLARLTDTVADTQQISIEQRMQLLEELVFYFSNANELNSFHEFVKNFITHQTNQAEKNLLEQLVELHAWLYAIDLEDRQLILALLEKITTGQKWDLTYFQGNHHQEIICCESDEMLQRYLYLVAGCVGEFWTQLCFKHLPNYTNQNEQQMTQWGIAFGKGLQLTNILRDIRADATLNRCYFPLKFSHSVTQNQYITSLKEHVDILEAYRQQALNHLSLGYNYCSALHSKRIRFACMAPIYIGIKTLNLLKGFGYISQNQAPKITRKEIYVFILRFLLGLSIKQHLDFPRS